MPLPRVVASIVACAAVVAACSSDDKRSSPTTSTGPAVETGKVFPAERCAKNKAAGTITYLTGYDYAASASIVDVLVAKQKGYFDALCLTVQITASSDAEANYPIVADGTAQFSSGGSFSELVDYRTQHADADVVAVAVEAKTAIDGLIVKPGTAYTLADLRGTTIGVKGALPPSIRAMLAKAGLVEGTDYTTVKLDGFDPTQQITQANIVGFHGYKSNEPGQLDRAGIAYTLFDPSTDGIAGSFGLLYTNGAFLADHPSAAQDFMRATMQGLADAIADPGAASMIALDFIDNNGNPNSLSADGETFRWQTESKLVVDSTPAGEPVGMPDRNTLGAEVTQYAAIGLFGGKPPDIESAYDASVLQAIYDTSNHVVWPL